MASYVLYLVTGALLALMAGRHLILMLGGHPHAEPAAVLRHLNLLHAPPSHGFHWIEAAFCTAILLFGILLTAVAGFLLISPGAL